ncbi:MAG: hypothetical protein V3T30_02715 [Thermodesulfobacteriota bacterium]
MTEEKKYLDWYNKEKKQGLEDIKFYTGDLSKVSKEGFFQEVNLINQSVEERCIVIGEHKAGKV